MAKQSDRLGEITVTGNPQSASQATTLAQVTEDASAWSVVDGVKQQKGWAYCDGSTLDNSGGEYADFLTAHGSLVLPNGPFRTVEVDLNVTGITNTPPGWAFYHSEAIAYSDTEGNWRLRFNISANATGFTNDSIRLTGVTFAGSATEDQGIAVIRNTSGGPSRAFVDATTSEIVVVHDTATDTSFKVSGDVALASKPTTWADANLESYPIISLNNNNANVISTKNLQASGNVTVGGDLDVTGVINGGEASTSQAGTVVKNRVGTIYLQADETTDVADISVGGDPLNSGFKFTGLTIGNWYELTMSPLFEINANAATLQYVLIRANHNGVWLDQNTLRNDGLSDTVSQQVSTVVKFKATGTTVLFEAEIATPATMRGNPSNRETKCQLVELKSTGGNDLGNDFA